MNVPDAHPSCHRGFEYSEYLRSHKASTVRVLVPSLKLRTTVPVQSYIYPSPRRLLTQATVPRLRIQERFDEYGTRF
jgi:hypothetical protein